MRLVLLCILIFCFLKGTSTEITGYNAEYAGKKISFFRYADPVTQEKEPAFILEIDKTGTFRTKVEIDSPVFVFADFGVYRGNLFLEPDQPIELLFPTLRDKTYAEQKNPYFSPLEFWFATKQGTLLNDKISAFENLLNGLTDKYFNQLFYNQSRVAFDSVQAGIENLFPDYHSPVYEVHKELRLKSVEMDAFRLATEKVTPVLQGTHPLFWTHPSFIQLFDKTFAGKLGYEVKTTAGNTVHKAISEGNVMWLLNFIKSNYKTECTFTELALLKMLHDGFYSGEFNQLNILSLVNKKALQSSDDKLIRKISDNVIKKLNHLRKGTKAPEICLKDINGHDACTGANNDKYKYIVFADTEMMVVREQLKYLSHIKELFDNHLEIYVVLLKTDLIEMKKFLVEENIPGTHLVDEQSKFIYLYRIKSFPTCFLLNSSHEVVFQDARAPLDGFEQQFGPYLRNELFLKQRNQSR